ncbi:manganese/zinc/iron transport system permease protein [Natranaerovirga hydrolytica]|uniref:Manganese/zinc/iron transport system permease protein n=1 Tax=Natranaerovirga hydrolytica TaxID=680378 RepID=A0A4R1MZB7_9FIRM|nr:metal ABC transporter permease [Natranaerovirga hydrolytica]TCK98616.1 manganese/zinc/iron transport system permease protein [Natranaerovirga hydrolytica]
MSLFQIEILIIGILTAVSCALVGVFLVLRQMAMMSDAISHTILLGIVVFFFITKDLSSPLLILGATLTGLATVFLVELVHKAKLISEDASIGLIFPFLFSIGIILISRYAGNVHLDLDAVLLGEIAFAPFERMVVNGVDIGAKSIYMMGLILLINTIYITLFYKELKIVTFDQSLAFVLGISPVVIHYSFMGLVSVTAVGAFNAVGAVLVIALMVGPAISAYFLTHQLKKIIGLSIFFSMLSTVLGFYMAFLLDVSIAGAMAVMIGIIFLIVVTIAPKDGIIANLRKEKEQEIEMATMTLLLHLKNLEKTDDTKDLYGIESIQLQLRWKEVFLNKVIYKSLENEYVVVTDNRVALTQKGRLELL